LTQSEIGSAGILAALGKLRVDFGLPPEPLRRLETGFPYPVKIADALIELSEQVDRRLVQQEEVLANA
jgi:hypothetical protein